MKVIANNLPQKFNLQEQLNNLTAEDVGALPLLTISDMELTNETTLEELAMHLINRPEAYFTLSIWSNQNTYRQLWNDINTKIGTTNTLGNLIISRKDSVLYFDFAIYNTADVYHWSYTTMNNKGMCDAHKIQSTIGDTADNTVTFSNSDTAEPNEWTEVASLSSGERHSSLLNKISTMFKNVRYLYKMLGTTDISALGNGTITGGLSSLNETFTNQISKLNTNLLKYYIYSEIITCTAGAVREYIFPVDEEGKKDIFYLPYITNASSSLYGVTIANEVTASGMVHVSSPITQDVHVRLVQFYK